MLTVLKKKNSETKYAIVILPLWQFLREKKFELGKNALMVAAQPMDRLLANLPVSFIPYSYNFLSLFKSDSLPKVIFK